MRESDIKDVLIRNYMPYAKGTIVSRAIPSIDGMKPANRRILYTMYKMGLIKGDKKKSAKIVGQVMTYHPHGDGSIYDTMVRMATGHEALNVPYVESKGNFGKVWSKNMAYAASRYTEAKLSPICAELFEGMGENAVDMVDNFDNTELEPSILPVKFPTVLVNASHGIAVGRHSNISPFGLKEVCNATIGMLTGKVAEPADLMDVLGYPEFSTGGYIHEDPRELMKLYTTGRGSFTITGKVLVGRDSIIITEIPYRTNVESIISDIKDNMKEELKEVQSVKDLSDINGMRVQIVLKRGTDIRKAVYKIRRLTKLRTTATFNNSVIIDNRCKTLGVYDMLNEWIKFRMGTLTRVYQHRYEKKKEQVELLETWEKIQNDIKFATSIITLNVEEKAIKNLRENFKLTLKQCQYLLDMKIRLITVDRLQGKLKELAEARADMQEYQRILSSDEAKKEVIVKELAEIRDKYGVERRTSVDQPVRAEEYEKEEPVISDEVVKIVITKSNKIKKLVTLKDFSNFEPDENDPVRFQFACKNNEYILVFTYSGWCYKILADDVDSSKGYPKESLFKYVQREDNSEIIYAMPAGDFSGYFNVVYGNGRGTTVYLSKVAGNRKKYKNVFEPSVKGDIFITRADKFFIITRRSKAAYIDLEYRRTFSTREAFKVGTVTGDDYIFGIQPADRVPDINSVDLSRYRKGYCVKIVDTLWEKE